MEVTKSRSWDEEVRYDDEKGQNECPLFNDSFVVVPESRRLPNTFGVFGAVRVETEEAVCLRYSNGD
ncbi:hypothetical protein RUM44_000290 [Polyplax serrata]|uniref:Uncharacterized protein n=1 Tax=Polyplax serrata TaxID=468196 RepID=A0ABR1B534_POLSC